ncbi:MAG: hypothetical protein ACREVZ_03535 [Burkholderiales bacterium]
MILDEHEHQVECASAKFRGFPCDGQYSLGWIELEGSDAYPIHVDNYTLTDFASRQQTFRRVSAGIQDAADVAMDPAADTFLSTNLGDDH